MSTCAKMCRAANDYNIALGWLVPMIYEYLTARIL